MRDKLLFALSIIVCVIACNTKKGDAVFRKVNSYSSGIVFSNKLAYSDSLTVLDFEYLFNGSGVGIIDINNDGLQDIFFGGNMVSCRLYLNKGNLRFEDITEKAGVGTTGWVYGISVVDINHDSYPDIYICKAGNRRTPPSEMKNIFFINNRNNTFTDRAHEMRLDDDGYDIHASFFDYDKDGDLDMYLLRNAFVNYNRNTAREKKLDGGAPSTDKLFQNNGNLTFKDVSKEAGITIEGFGLGATVCDLNNDNWPDIYVSNDFLTNDLAWINNGNGTFTNRAPDYLRHQTYNGMGNDVADFNNDGLEDIMVVDMLPPDNKRRKLTMRGNAYEEFENALGYGYEPQYVRNTLQLNNGNGTFSEIGQLANVSATEWSWAPLFADFNNDGYKDLFVSNGYRQDITNLDFIRYGKNALFVGTPEANRKERLVELQKYPGIKVHNYIFSNSGDLTFKDVSTDWGMKESSYSNGAAYADFDNDGDLDLIINNLEEPASLYENRSSEILPENKWLRVGFKNGEAPGAKVWIWQNGRMQMLYNTPYRGYLSSMEPFLQFGLKDSIVDSLKVLWPDGNFELIKNITSNKLLWADHDKSLRQPGSSQTAQTNLFSSYKDHCKIYFKHEEDKFVDFKNQPLLPHMLSHEGPGLAAADVNGDGLDDIFAGAAAGSKPEIFIQHKNGTFTKNEMPVNTADNMGALFFDADMDGDADLYVAAGGSSATKRPDTLFLHHFYVNDGKGNFTESSSAIPKIFASSSSMGAADFDNDGDLDLFVGGRLSPGKYPMTPRSYLLRNDSKNSVIQFTDISTTSGDDLSAPGMVTSFLWTDFDNDNQTDLMLVGEFMPIRFFKNTNAKFKEVTAETGLQNTHGWWNSIVSGDFDKDGDMDYVLGNLGLNSPLKASAEKPVCIYANDYDKDGRIDPVTCHFVDNEEYIIHARDDINRQMPPMRARFRTYEAYADVKFKDAFRKDEIAAATVFKSERFESVYIENKGGGKFSIRALPMEAQFAPVYAMLTGDFNDDGNPDVLAVGNSYSTEVQTGRYDAQGTLFMRGDGKGNLIPDRHQINVGKDNKSVIQFAGSDGEQMILIGTNSDSISVFKVNQEQKQVTLQPSETHALITETDDKKYLLEFYYGDSYLSQSSRKFFIPAKTRSVEIFNRRGSKRKIDF